jgi:protein-S-isoprenylcysteine O-methyltransferase Ste14
MLIYILLFALYYERNIFTEEAFLERKFGQDFIDWAHKTPALYLKLKIIALLLISLSGKKP